MIGRAAVAATGKGYAGWLGGVLPLTGVSAWGAATPLVFTPGQRTLPIRARSYRGSSILAIGGALWVTTYLNCETRSPLCSKLVIQVDPRHSVEMAYPKNLTDGLLAAESAAGPIPPTKCGSAQEGRRRLDHVARGRSCDPERAAHRSAHRTSESRHKRAIPREGGSQAPATGRPTIIDSSRAGGNVSAV
jgi:hypothetical protein